ncbi:ABC transporter substrate-binding protein [Mesobacterium pallidum]|uniref:ABC transporter substrate-binding protein n=1 Tax=Mesobacterium pallidum TaxID=2872037 RepID=UPI001EE19595|nr:ABC transporter substrate-binding protein [Mesobacterium pallidum]
MAHLTRRSVLASGLSSVLLTAFAQKVAAQGAGATVLKMAGTKAKSRLDPHVDVAWEVLMILSAMYDTLVFQDNDGNIVPGLATSWTVSDDAMSYEFTLRDGVTFHDGTPFDAEAVKYNIERIKALGPQSQKAASLVSDVASVEVVSPNVVRMIMAQPNGGLLFNLSLTYTGMVSPKASEEYGEEYHMHQAGTGPFMMTEYEVNDHYTLTRNPDYDWAPAIYSHDGPAMMETIEWRFLPEPASRSVALMAGDFDVVFDLLPTSLGRVERSDEYEVLITHLSGQPTYWFLNTELAPTDDINVRRAIMMGVDMNAAVEAIMRGIAPRAQGPLAAVTPEYAPSVSGMYPYDPEAAAKLLDEAGWTPGADGIRVKDGVPLTIKMQMAGWGSSEPFSVYVQSELQKIGVAVELEMMAWAVSLEAGKNGTHNMLFTGGSGFAASDSLMPYFLSENADAGYNFAKLRSAELDQLLLAAQAASDPDERLKLYQDAQTMIMDQAVILPIYDYAIAIGARASVAEALDFGVTGLTPAVYDVKL